MASMTPEERSQFARTGGVVGGNARAASLTKKEAQRDCEEGRGGALG
jgi:hypothetical protein